MSQRWPLSLPRCLRRLGIAVGLRGAEDPTAEALMEEAPSTAADIPVLRGAGILTAALAAVAAFRPLTWAAATSAADEGAVARTRSRGDIHLVRPAISRAIPISE